MVDVFAYFDGDDIGSRLELLLLDDKIKEAEIYSASVAAALDETRQMFQRLRTVQVVFAAGDDILARWSQGSVAKREIEDVCVAYENACGRSLSVGIGFAPNRAVLNLRKAKLSGKARLVSDPGSFDGARG